MGRRRLNTGEIYVLGGKPGTKGSGVPGRRVGYMPQVQFDCYTGLPLLGWIVGVG